MAKQKAILAVSLLNTIVTELANRGWEMTETACYERPSVLQVWGSCDGQTVLAMAPFRPLAWQMAAAQVLKVRQDIMQRRLTVLRREAQAAIDSGGRKLLNEIDEISSDLERDRAFHRMHLR